MRMEQDQYGRDVEMIVDGDEATYTVTGKDGASFSISVNADKPLDAVYSTINAMGPAGTLSLVEVKL